MVRKIILKFDNSAKFNNFLHLIKLEIKRRLVHPSSGKKKGFSKFISNLKGSNTHQRHHQSKIIED